MDGEMEFRLLGPFEVCHDGEPIDVGSGQQVQVLVQLLLRPNRRVSSAQLAEALWESPADRKPKNIITYVSRLNRVFKERGVAIEAEGSGYVLRVRPAQIDHVRFETLRERAREHVKRGDRVAARAELHEALALYRGEFMADLAPDQADLRLREDLGEARLNVLGDLAELELTAGNHRWVRDRLLPVVHEHPMRQRLTALLMEALLADGDPERAVTLYHLTKDALEEHRGMSPSQQLRDLLWRAQYGGTRTSLPPVTPELVGREAELEAITASAGRAAQRRDGPEVVWISGMPGVGKTAIAVRAATAVRRQFRDTQLYVDLRGFTPNVPATSTGEALDQLLRLLGVPPSNIPPTIEEKIVRYRAWLHDSRSVIVLDNADSERQVEPLLPTSPGCLVIVTSRHVGGPAAHTRMHLDPLELEAAVTMFTKIVGPGRVGEDWPAVQEIVLRCGRVPLQIKVAATRLLQHQGWPLSHLAELLREHTGLPLDDAALGEGGAACAVSFDQLDEDQRRLFLLFGTAPVTELDGHAAAALTGTSAPRARSLLSDLHRVSLLAEVSPERYEMPDLLRSFAVSAHGAASDLGGLLGYYLATTAAAAAQLFPFDVDRQPKVPDGPGHGPRFGGRDDASHWLAGETANLVALVEHAAAHGDADTAARLGLLLWRFCYLTGDALRWERMLATALAAGPPAELAPHVVLRLSGARWSLGRYDDALDLARKAFDGWTATGDAGPQADALCAMAMAAINLGRYLDAGRHLDGALERYVRIEDRRGQANALGLLGVLHDRRGDLAAAQACHVRACELLRELGHLPGLLRSLDNLGSVRLMLDRPQEALADHQAALELAVQLGDRAGQGQALNNIGNVLHRLGRLGEAIEHHDRALAIAVETGNLTLRTDAHYDLGETYRTAHAYHESLRSHQIALGLARKTGDTRERLRACLGAARAMHATGDHDGAAGHWLAALAGYTEHDPGKADAITQELAELPCRCADVRMPPGA